jgi:hypothetical protein
LAASLAGLKNKKDELEASLKDVNGVIRTLSEETLPRLMEDLEQDSFRVPNVGTVFLQQKVYANVKADDREKFHAWLRENGHGDIIKETVHPQTLTAFAKEQLGEGKPLPDTVSARFVPTAVIRRS